MHLDYGGLALELLRGIVMGCNLSILLILLHLIGWQTASKLRYFTVNQVDIFSNDSWINLVTVSLAEFIFSMYSSIMSFSTK